MPVTVRVPTIFRPEVGGNPTVEGSGSTVRSLRALDDASWARSGTHETFGELDAAGLMILAVDHDEEHLGGLGA